MNAVTPISAAAAVVKAIDTAVADFKNKSYKPRTYMGASSLGDPCKRKVWYGFRWFYHEQHTGRMHRLFQRGHNEEFEFVKHLRFVGYEVRDYATRLLYHDGSDSYYCEEWEAPPFEPDLDDVHQDRVHIERATQRGEGPAQYSFEDVDGHVAGHADGVIRGEGLPDGWGLTEYKTHNDKSFKKLSEKGVLSSHPKHWVQMQIYMNRLGLAWGLYLAVNKNDDTLYAEIVLARPEIATQYLDFARNMVYSQTPPKRLSNDKSWWECKFCKFREICHYDADPQKNCRTCAYSAPQEDGTWRCNLFSGTLPGDFMLQGCDKWYPIK